MLGGCDYQRRHLHRIFTEVKLYMEAGLQLVYIAMAMVGWIFWGKDDSDEALAVTTRPMQFHLIAISGISIAAACTGFLLSHYTDAARPFVDSMTTVAAIVCTWMVTRKILENWLYWIVINCVSVWLFMDRGLDLTSGLFVLYALLSVSATSLGVDPYFSKHDMAVHTDHEPSIEAALDQWRLDVRRYQRSPCLGELLGEGSANRVYELLPMRQQVLRFAHKSHD